MSDFNGIAGSTGYPELVKRLLGADLNFDTVAPELGVGITLESDRTEWHFLRGSRLWSTGRLLVAAGGAGQFGIAQVAYVGQQNMLAVLTHAKILAAPNSQFQLKLDVAQVGGAGTQIPTRDPRSPSPTLREFTTSSAAPGGTVIDAVDGFAALALEDLALTILPAIVVPGHTLSIVDQTANEAFTVIMAGYERPARPEELGL